MERILYYASKKSTLLWKGKETTLIVNMHVYIVENIPIKFFNKRHMRVFRSFSC